MLKNYLLSIDYFLNLALDYPSKFDDTKMESLFQTKIDEFKIRDENWRNQIGGYRKKYLKYKIKYLNLQNKVNNMK